MALKFTSPIASRVSTVNLERQLLHAFLHDRMSLQRTIGKHRSEFFTSTSRQFIYDCVRTEFDDHRMTLSREKFAFDIQKRYDSGRDKDRIADIEAEFELIQKTELTGDVDQIIHDLEDVQLANATDSLIRESYRLLEEGKYEESADLLRRKSIDLSGAKQEHRVLNLHVDSDDWFQEVRNRKEHPEQYAGVPTGFKRFDEKTGGLFPAELTIVFGLSGKGKSTFMKALSCNIRKQGRVVLHCGNEENEFQMRSKYMSADSGEKYSPFKRGTYTDEEYRRLKIFSDNARGVGAIYIYEFPQQTDATWIERAVHFLEMNNVHVDVIVVDYLDLMKPIGTAYSENDEGGKITSDLKQLAINCNCPVVTATQAGIQSEKQEKKAKPFLNASDVFGTKRKVHSANTLIGIVNQTATAMAQELPEEQRRMHHMVLCVPKNRDGAVFTFRQVMDAECGRFYEDTNPDDPALNNLEKQAMQMIDDTGDPKHMRAEIDLNEVQQAVADNYRKKLDAIESTLRNGNSASRHSAAEKNSPAVEFGKKTEFDAAARAAEDALYADEDDSLGPATDDDPLLGGALPDAPAAPAAPAAEDSPADDFLGAALATDGPDPLAAAPAVQPSSVADDFLPEAKGDEDRNSAGGQKPAAAQEKEVVGSEPSERGASPERPADKPGEAPAEPPAAVPAASGEVYTADDMDTAAAIPFDIGMPKPPSEQGTPPSPPRKKNFADYLAEKKRLREQQGGSKS